MQIEPAGVLRGAVDGRIEIELLGDTFPGEAAKPPQRDLDVARVELDRVVEVAEGPLVPDLDRAAASAALLADANALGVVAVGAERARSRRPDPLRPALVPRALLLQALLQRLHQLVPASERFHQRFLLIG